MTTPGPAVRLATFEDAGPIADLLADAFVDYEWSRWAVPADDRRERLRGLHLLYAVTLCSNPTTGFSWQEPEISDAAVVNLADKSFGAPGAGESPVVGAAGTEDFTFKATAKGTSTVVLRYSQPWVGGASSEWTYTLTVTVK